MPCVLQREIDHARAACILFLMEHASPVPMPRPGLWAKIIRWWRD
jgi:hypothetical protein